MRTPSREGGSWSGTGSGSLQLLARRCVVVRRSGPGHLALGNGKEICILEHCTERRGLLSPAQEKHGMASGGDDGGYKCNALLLYLAVKSA